MDIDNAPHNIERSHRIGQPRQPVEKQRLIIVKFVRYKDRNKIFRNKKRHKGKKNFDSRKPYSKHNGKIERITGAT